MHKSIMAYILSLSTLLTHIITLIYFTGILFHIILGFIFIIWGQTTQIKSFLSFIEIPENPNHPIVSVRHLFD